MVKLQKIAICLICNIPEINWMDFLNKFMYYQIFFIIRDNSANYQELYGSTYENIQFIQMNNNDYITNGFIDYDFSEEAFKDWYKALYYFSSVNTNFEHVWFVEEDVFFHSEYTLKNLDTRHHRNDLLSKSFIVDEEKTTDWHWYKIHTQYEFPMFHTMTNIVRMSKSLLSHIRVYAETHKKVFFIEALIPTVAMKHGLICSSPDEMNHIYFKHDFDLNILNKRELYHPFSDTLSHSMLRELVDMKTRYDTFIDRIKNRYS
jgi:hypothetical protein